MTQGFVRTHRARAENGSKNAKKRELGENGENSGENKSPVSACFSGCLKNIKRELLHQSSAVDQIIAKRCKNDYREIL